jgi:DNA-directed RNA polymerase specialized sigma24 family protein
MKPEPNGQGQLRWYFVKKFIYKRLPFQTFYRILYGYLFKRYLRNFSGCTEDFDDTFQSSMLKFCEAVQTKRYDIETNGQAYAIFTRMFRNTMIDLFRKGNPFTEMSDRYETAVVEETDSRTIAKAYVKELFEKMDKRILRDLDQLSKREHQFYLLYKHSMSQFATEKEIKVHIISQMKINKSYYAKLKSVLLERLKKLIGDNHD